MEAVRQLPEGQFAPADLGSGVGVEEGDPHQVFRHGGDLIRTPIMLGRSPSAAPPARAGPRVRTVAGRGDGADGAGVVRRAGARHRRGDGRARAGGRRDG
ncbi:hypothetical protein GCM10022225_10980 [Plantactinospora mayteni]|uniref:Uncharacterized protein n=1 Tax=Plantactinospora mayteni TaxID=566021 RepID=A0ABQ4EHD1_9ACTN|nr:hypothetical protein Pma05_07230 [Plantactinospora mayteni]